MARTLITARDLEADRNLRIPPGALLTPLARDLLRRRGVDADRLADLGKRLGADADKLWSVPQFERDIHDLQGLAELADVVFSSD